MMVMFLRIPLVFTLFFIGQICFGQLLTESFEFQFENKTLKGVIEKPEGQVSKGIIILIPGYGRTDFVEGKWFYNLRSALVSTGLTVCVWDKMGCGNSEGQFDAQQPVENSATEAIAAIHALKERQVPGHEKIGLWGLSRAGWICPLINEQHPIDFWISVSGTDDKENYGYLVQSNLRIAGKSTAETEKLYQAWMQGHKLICMGASYEAYAKAIEPLRQDSLCRKLFGYTNLPATDDEIRTYYAIQETYTSKGHFDFESGLWVYIEDFDDMLTRLNCPVLAIFGANDTQVDWRKTKQLYENTIGSNPKANLVINVFENCNHSLQKCTTCAFREDLSALDWQPCDNYFETIKTWLIEEGILE